MKKVFLFILFMFLLYSILIDRVMAQYDPNILEYRMKVYKLMNIPDTTGFHTYTFPGDTAMSIKVRWDHQGVEVPWNSPNDRLYIETKIVQNSAGLWSGNEATSDQPLVFLKGYWYEITMTSYGVASYDPRESNECKPFYVWSTVGQTPAVLNLYLMFQ